MLAATRKKTPALQLINICSLVIFISPRIEHQVLLPGPPIDLHLVLPDYAPLVSRVPVSFVRDHYLGILLATPLVEKGQLNLLSFVLAAAQVLKVAH